MVLIRLQIEGIVCLARGKQGCGLEASEDALVVVKVELYILAGKRREAS